MACLYTVHKCKSSTNDEKLGDAHYADNDQETICGLSIDEKWYISDNTFTGIATCPKCIEIDKSSNLINRTRMKGD